MIFSEPYFLNRFTGPQLTALDEILQDLERTLDGHAHMVMRLLEIPATQDSAEWIRQQITAEINEYSKNIQTLVATFHSMAATFETDNMKHASQPSSPERITANGTTSRNH